MINRLCVWSGLGAIWLGNISCSSDVEFFGFNKDRVQVSEQSDEQQDVVSDQERYSGDLDSEKEEIEICLAIDGSECDQPELDVPAD
jgi:hypothetical protein